ncbi:MAG TPA: PASTA domain-containing protein [Terriglobales bacterium]|nr:PASTA domain-containing protein [Terriglobales bacterium]
MRRFFSILLLTLVLMTVALVSALTAMRFAIHGREVVVPNVVGMSPADADRAGSPLGLQLIVEREFYSADVPEGRIINQMPLSGTKVRRGWSIRVARSLGPQRVSIPDVIGESERAAEVNIRRRGLALGSTAELAFSANSPSIPSNALPDQVISQNPPANASGVSAPRINLLVASGTEPAVYVMPNLTGQPLGSATLALQDAGMREGKVSLAPALPNAPSIPNGPQSAAGLAFATPAPSQPGPASMIVTQSPAPGQKVVAGTAVNFEVR